MPFKEKRERERIVDLILLYLFLFVNAAIIKIMKLKTARVELKKKSTLKNLKKFLNENYLE